MDHALKRTTMWRRGLALVVAFVVAAAIGITTVPDAAPASAAELSVARAAAPVARDARAITGADFIPGNIISDELFYDRDAMTTAQIQAFLNSKIGTCSNGKCLNVLKVAVPTVALTASYSDSTGALKCSAMSGGTISAAELIYRAQVACGISAKVILVTLQKEQGLTTKSAPSDTALKYAMGMACPDTAACASYAAGFANQIYYGTRQLITYKVSRFSKQPGVNTIGYHPNAACGATTFNIQNYATAALYAYTPYRPNAAALANLSGTGDSCSSYGNRNFWVYYTNWFGSTHSTTPSLVAAPGLGEPAAYLLTTDYVGDMWIYPAKTDGTAGYTARVKVGSGWSAMSAIISVGDFNGDKTSDVVARDGAGLVWLYPRDGQGGWLPRKIITSGWNKYDTIFPAGDFSGDGLPDIFARDTTGVLWLFTGNGAGGLTTSIRVGGGWGIYRPYAGGDFTGDGLADLFAVDSAGKLWVYPGNGKGGGTARVQIAGTWGGFTSISGGVDLNKDGKVDIVARDGATGSLVFYPGAGSNTLAPSVSLGAGWDQFSTISPSAVVDQAGLPVATVEPASTALDDFTGDGKADILAQDAAGSLWVYPGTDTGSFGARQKLSGTWRGYTSLFGVGDFTGDGRPDLMGRDASGAVYLFPTTSTGWGTRARIATGWQSFTAVYPVGDFSGDGLPDVMIRDASGVLWLYPGNGTSGFKSSIKVGGGWGIYRPFSAGDFDGDGKADLFAIDSAGKLWLYPGNGAGGGSPRIQVPGTWTSTTTLIGGLDLNADGKVDLLGRDSAGVLTFYPGDGAAGYTTPVALGGGWGAFTAITSPTVIGEAGLPVTTVQPVSTAPDDLTGDGKADLLARDATGALWVYPGTDAGALGPRARLAGTWKGYTTLFGAGDVNRDGRPDLIGRDTAGVVWLIPTTASGWGTRVTMASGWAGFTAVFPAGDFTADGNPDVFARDAAGALWLYPGNGSTGFKAPIRMGGGWTPYRPAGSGDVNGDGRQDILAIDSAGLLWAYLGNASRNGWETRVQVAGAWGTYTELIGGVDLTGDGKPDIVARDAAGALKLFAGNGAGVYAAGTTLAADWRSLLGTSGVSVLGPAAG